jgi:integrase/recombinase XerD
MPNLYKRGRIYWARFKVAGQEYRGSLRTAVQSDAERRLKSWKKEVEEEVRFGIAAPQTWAATVLSWNTHATRDLNPKTHKRYLVSLKQVRPFLDGLDLRKINAAKLRELIKARRQLGVTNATIKRDLTAISSVPEENPTLTVRHRRLKERRDPIVLPDDEEIEMMKAASTPRFADAIDFARETGMRESEIFGLTWKQLKTNDVPIVGKRNKLRVIPLSKRARAIAERQPRHIKQPYVFWHGEEGAPWGSPASRFGNIRRKVAKKAQKAAQPFRGFRFHDLRHLYAVEYLRRRKGSLYDLQQLLGHTSIKTTEIYLEHLTPEQKSAAMHGEAQTAAQV